MKAKRTPFVLFSLLTATLSSCAVLQYQESTSEENLQRPTIKINGELSAISAWEVYDDIGYQTVIPVYSDSTLIGEEIVYNCPAVPGIELERGDSLDPSDYEALDFGNGVFSLQVETKYQYSLSIKAGIATKQECPASASKGLKQWIVAHDALEPYALGADEEVKHDGGSLDLSSYASKGKIAVAAFFTSGSLRGVNTFLFDAN